MQLLSCSPTFPQAKQRGAALVVGLILLVALTLLALASMNTATLDLIMAGNEQYRTRAFQAAEAGIEAALLNDAALDTAATTTVSNVVIGDDTYSYTVKPVKNGAAMDPPSGSTVGKFQAVYFNITATGSSTRGASASHTQGFLKIVPNTESFSGGNDLGGSSDTDGDGDTDSDDSDIFNFTP